MLEAKSMQVSGLSEEDQTQLMADDLDESTLTPVARGPLVYAGQESSRLRSTVVGPAVELPKRAPPRSFESTIGAPKVAVPWRLFGVLLAMGCVSGSVARWVVAWLQR